MKDVEHQTTGAAFLEAGSSLVPRRTSSVAPTQTVYEATCGDNGVLEYSGLCDSSDCPAPKLPGPNAEWKKDCGPMPPTTYCIAQCKPGFRGRSARTEPCAKSSGLAPRFRTAMKCDPIQCEFPVLSKGMHWLGKCASADGSKANITLSYTLGRKWAIQKYHPQNPHICF